MSTDPKNDESAGKKSTGAEPNPEDLFFGTEGDPSSEGADRGFGFSEVLKKVAAAGLSAAFLTEESIRHFLGDIRLPKETLNLILQGAAKSKEELTNRIGNEVIKMVSKIDFVKEASRFAEEHKFRISAEVEVIRKDSGELAFKIDPTSKNAK